MKRNYSLKRLYIYFILFISILLIVFFSYTWVNKQRSFLNYQISEFKKRLLEKENNEIKQEVKNAVHNIKYKNLIAKENLKKELKRKVDFVYGAIASLVKKYKNKMSDDELKTFIKTFLRDIRFKNNGYFFITTMNGIEILYPIKPEFENKSIINLQDVKGRYVIKDEISLLKKYGEGFVTDYWIKNKEDKREYLKISYVKKLNIFNWYIGTGEYLDDFKENLKKEALIEFSKRRFGKSGYLYVNTYSGYSLLLNGKINKKPINFINKQDSNGNFTTKMQISTVKSKGNGFINYYWSKIGETKPIKKTAFVMGMNNWKWIVGAGYYHDEINNVIKDAKKKFFNKFYIEIIRFIFFTIFIIFIIFLFIYLLNKYLSNQFKIFLNLFKEATLKNELIEDKNIKFKELLFLTDAINDIIKENKELEMEIFNKRRLESLGVLAGGIAHDFNNLLTAILANISIAKEYKDIDKIKTVLNDAESATDRARSLTQQLLTFSKGGEPILKTLKLPNFIKKTTDFLLSGTNIGIKYNFSDNLLNVKADKGQLGQVLENLVINAKQAMPKGGNITISLENVELDNYKNEKENFIKLSIADTGVGIDKNNIDKIFDPYFTTKKSGNGLGLASVYSIIRKHKGVISVDSELTKGTTFIIYLPGVIDEEEKKEVSITHFNISKKRILIMDDEEMILNISKKLFSKLGFDVSTCKNGEEMLAEYKKSIKENKKIDIVLMDLTIHGGMGGEEAISKLIELDSKAIAIVSSGYSNSPVMANYEDYGFTSCLVKPYKLDDIRLLISEILNK